MTTVAFLQNQWFKNPDSARRIFAKHPGRRQRIIADFLFMGCLTGRRLESAFGDGCNKIIWENVSKEIGGESSFKFPADPEHIESVIEQFKPNVILTFGAIAAKALRDLEGNMFKRSCMFQLRYCPHPAARHKDVKRELHEAAKWWQNFEEPTP